MDAKLFLRNKSIFNKNYIYNLDDEAFELSNLLTEYAQALQLLQANVVGQSEQLGCNFCGADKGLKHGYMPDGEPCPMDMTA